VDLGQTVVYTWGVLPTGLTTIVLAVRNSIGAGGCAAPSGSNVITLTYDDDIPDCATTGPYSTTATQAINVVGPNLVVDKSPRQPHRAGRPARHLDVAAHQHRAPAWPTTWW
jgi:hypothetical protein